MPLFAARGRFFSKLLEGEAAAWIILVVVIFLLVVVPFVWRRVTAKSE